MWYICFVISLACLVFIPVVALLFGKFGLLKKLKLSFFNSLFVSVFFSTFFMFIPVNFSNCDGSFLSWLREFLSTLSRAMVVFGGGCDEKVINASLQYCPEGFGIVYQVLGELLSILGPILAVGFVLSFFSNISEKIKLYFSRFDDLYVFSELNEKSLLLATSFSSDKKSTIVFTSVIDTKKEEYKNLIEKAKIIDAILLTNDVVDVNLRFHSKKKNISFFILGENETLILDASIQLIQKYKNRPKTDLYVFSTKKDCEIILSAADKGQIKVRRINEVHSNVFRYLYESGGSLFDSARSNEDGTKTISAIVVGMGRYGTEFVKALSWYGQMIGYKLKITAFDKDAAAKDKFTALAPELISDTYNGKKVEGEVQCAIEIHSNIDTETNTFFEMIDNIYDATYVIVALGDDNANIKTAVELRERFERNSLHPMITTIVYNPKRKNNLIGLKNFKNEEYEINYICDTTKTYSKEIIVNSELEEEGRKVHMKYEGSVEADFWNYEYHYSSSIASAIHKKAKIYCGIPGADKEEKDLTIEERDIIEPLEHRRWNAYMRSIGYVYGKTRSDLAKTHNDLVHFDDLSEEEKRKDSRVATD